MMAQDSEAVSITPERCPDCGAFCGVVFRGIREVTSCVNCGRNPPKCAEETGTVNGCQTDATHVGTHRDGRRDRYWCEDHAPEDAGPLPYMDGGSDE